MRLDLAEQKARLDSTQGIGHLLDRVDLTPERNPQLTAHKVARPGRDEEHAAAQPGAAFAAHCGRSSGRPRRSCSGYLPEEGADPGDRGWTRGRSRAEVAQPAPAGPPVAEARPVAERPRRQGPPPTVYLSLFRGAVSYRDADGARRYGTLAMQRDAETRELDAQQQHGLLGPLARRARRDGPAWPPSEPWVFRSARVWGSPTTPRSRVRLAARARWARPRARSTGSGWRSRRARDPRETAEAARLMRRALDLAERDRGLTKAEVGQASLCGCRARANGPWAPPSARWPRSSGGTGRRSSATRWSRSSRCPPRGSPRTPGRSRGSWRRSSCSRACRPWQWLRAAPDPQKPLALGRAMGWTLGGLRAWSSSCVAGTSLCSSPAPLVGWDEAVLPRNWLGTASLAGKLGARGRGRVAARRAHRRLALRDRRRAPGPRATSSSCSSRIGPTETRINLVRKDLANLVQIANAARGPGRGVRPVSRGRQRCRRACSRTPSASARGHAGAPRPMPVFFGTAFAKERGDLVRHAHAAEDARGRRGPSDGGRGPLRAQDEGHLVAYSEADAMYPLGAARLRPPDVESAALGPHRARLARDEGRGRRHARSRAQGRPGPGCHAVPVPRPGGRRPDARLRRAEGQRGTTPAARPPFRARGHGQAGRPPEHTPFPPRQIPGVVIHAYAVEALASGKRIRRVPWWVSVLGLLYPCLSIAGRAVRGDRARTLVLSAVARERALRRDRRARHGT